MRPPFILLLSAALLLTGCDLLGIEGMSAVADKRAAEGKAVGGACRYAGRDIEDCYAQNKKADKAAMFAGWREMNDYMRENKIEPAARTAPTDVAVKADDEEAKSTKAAGKGAKKGG
ncbi:MAG: hypothetical protein Q8N44_18465 [Rubrivivax sp.]|nr:hypothetical protein [Rubrivivax sp.]